MNDWQLLEEYVELGAEAAFAELVKRHLNLVHSAAFRRTGDAHAAQDVTQSVFCLLAQKARKMPRSTSIVGWLYQTACFKASEYCRNENRQRQREKETALMQMEAATPDKIWEDLTPHLEVSMSALSDEDRLAVLLRFFERKGLRDIGMSLGVSEDAARMRVNRALERLRELLTKRGVICPAAILGAVISERAIQAAPNTALPLVLSAVGSAMRGPLPASVSLLSNPITRIAALGLSAVVVCVVYTRFMSPAGSGLNGPQAESVAGEAVVKAPMSQRAAVSAADKTPMREVPDAFASLRSILYSRVPDGNFVFPEDLKNAIQALEDRNDEMVAILVAALKDARADVRLRAVCSVGFLGPKADAAYSELWPLIKDPHALQLSIQSMLEIRPGTQTISELIEFDRSNHLDNLSSVGSAIRHLVNQDSTVIPEVDWLLTSYLDDSSAAVRGMAALELANLPGKKPVAVIPKLIAELEKADCADDIFEAVGDFGPRAKAALPVLKRIQNSTNEWRRDLAGQAIGQIETEPATAALDAENQTFRDKIAKDQLTVAELVDALDSRDVNVPLDAMFQLKKLGPKAVEALPGLRLHFARIQHDPSRGGDLDLSLCASVIKAIDPQSPTVYFPRSDLLPAFRAAESAVGTTEPANYPAYQVGRPDGCTLEELIAWADQLGKRSPQSQKAFVSKIQELDPAVGALLTRK